MKCLHTTIVKPPNRYLGSMIVRVFYFAAIVLFLSEKTAGKERPSFLESIHAEKAFRQIVLDWLKKYDPEGHEIVAAYEDLPLKFLLSDGTEVSIGSKDKISNYFSKRTMLGLLENIGTLVHEYNHFYTSQMPYTLQSRYPMKMVDEYYHYFIDKGKQISVKCSPLSPASAIAAMVPEQIRKERYELYIKGNTSTQTDGVFALLDEMNAYRLDMQSYLGVYYYLKDIGTDDQELWRLFLSNIQNIRLALYEFRYFILVSMAFMSEQQPTQYQAIMNNKPFMEAYADINSRFEILDSRYDSLKITLLKYFEQKGVPAEVDGDYTFIGETGIKNYDKYRNKVVQALQDIQLKTLHEQMLTLSGK